LLEVFGFFAVREVIANDKTALMMAARKALATTAFTAIAIIRGMAGGIRLSKH
jgi:hypothetical protein